MIKKNIVIPNKLGLHARPCALIVKTAAHYRSDFFIEKDGMQVNGKSIMGVMMLAAEYQSEIDIIADGIDEQHLIKAIEDLFNTKFDEE